MFGGPNKNPFGSSTFGKESTPRPVTARKRANNEPSGLYGMPPVPQIGETPPVFASKSTVNEGTNLFQGALKDSGLTNKPVQNPFGAPTKTKSETIFGKPLDSSPFLKAGESSAVFSKPSQPSSSSPPKPDLLTRSSSQDLFGISKAETSSAFKNPFEKHDNKDETSKNPFKPFEPSAGATGDVSRNPFQVSGTINKPPANLFGMPKRDEQKSVFSRLQTKKTEEQKENPSQFRISRPIVKATLPSYFSDQPEEPEQPTEEIPTKPTIQPSKKLERLKSVEELKAIKSIICEQVPASAMNKKVLEKHFSRFGKVQKVVLFAKKSSASVVFETHQSAKKAKEKGQTINPSIPPIGAIYYKKVRKSTESVTEVEQPVQQQPKEEIKSLFKVNTKELMDIMKSQAHSDTDRYTILDARDKWMRARAPPKTGEVRLRGCCPDICPEKERYSRAIKNQLRIYEKMDGNVNHKSTLKEYSRSSADQEMPLLHELRPSSVLKRAMDHLLCNIIDRIEVDYGFMEEWYDNVENQTEDSQRIQSDNVTENIGEWFEYTWSTTRALRKDITQQDLTKDPIAIDIMEKCARYHIVCAERLIEADSTDFSRKLNDENLTKCMQTLQHMYYDMSVDGHKCPNEAEFRAYDVLLNINEGDTLRKVSTLDEEVRRSPEINFAIQVLNAVNNNNYVRFFKLVQKSSLLQGCILVRYFNQVRRRGLETIVRAYTPNAKTVLQFSLSRLMSMLAFESVAEASKFCSSHGIEAEPDSNIVYMERTAFFHPESLPFKRARILVESKRQVSWSAVINGGPLPPNPYLSYDPHDSFDANGFLKLEAYDASDQSLMSPQVPEIPVQAPIQPPVQVPNVQAEKAMLQRRLEQALMQVGDELLFEVLNEESNQISVKTAIVNEVAHEAFEEIKNKTMLDLCIEIAKETIKEAKNEELRSRLEREAKSLAADEVKDDLIEEVMDEMVKEVAKQEMMRVSKLLKYNQTSPMVVDDLVNEVLKELLEPEAKHAMENAHAERDDRIAKLKARQVLALKKRMFKSWFKYCKKRKSQRDLLKNFPCMPGSQMFKTSVMKTYSLKQTLQLQNEVEKLHQVIDLEDKYIEETLLKPYNELVEILNDLKIKHWKVVMCGPTLENQSPGKGLIEVIKKKLSINSAALDQDPGDHGLLSCFSSPMTSMCSRWIDQAILDEEIAYSEKKRRDYLTGTSALFFVHVDEEETFEEASDRLAKILGLIPKIPRIPILIFTTSKASKETIEANLALDKLEILSYEIVHGNVDVFAISTMLTIMKSLASLASQSQEFDLEQIDGLQVKLIRDYVEDFITDKFLSEIYLDSYHPGAMIKYFNDIIDHLALVVKDPKLEQISWPIPELKRLVLDEEVPSYWNDDPYLDHVQTWIKNLKLPPFVNDLDQYLSSVQSGNFAVTQSRILHILKKSTRKADFYWSDIIHALIDYKISLRPSGDPYSSQGSDMVVLFLTNTLSGFQPKKLPRMKNPDSSQPVNFQEPELKNSGLLHEIQNELNSSLIFEQNLRHLMEDDGDLIETTEKIDDDEEFQDVQEDFSNTFYEPVVSILSPHLGLVAGPRALQQRMEMGRKRPRSPAPSRLVQVQDGPEKKKVIKSHLVKNLNDKVQQELNSSLEFEQRLQRLTSE